MTTYTAGNKCDNMTTSRMLMCLEYCCQQSDTSELQSHEIRGPIGGHVLKWPHQIYFSSLECHSDRFSVTDYHSSGLIQAGVIL